MMAAYELVDIEDLVMGYFDIHKNELTGLEIDGIPALYWFPKGETKPVQLEITE